MSIRLIQQYRAKVEKIIRYGGSRNEGALRKSFQDLLESYAQSKNLLLVPEVEVRTREGRRVVPDGTLKDALRQDWGYWESKDEKDDLPAEIAAKFAKGYPKSNIFFEDSRTGVLYQDGEEVLRADFSDDSALDTILSRFVGYEPREVTEFHRAIEQFNADVPALTAELRAIIEEQYKANVAFQKALTEFLELCKKVINPSVEMADVREMIIQHLLTEDIFMTVFDDPQFHRDNVVAHKLQEVVGTFYQGETWHSIHNRIAPFYETINARAARIYSHFEKQKFLKALYEDFYRAYNPKAADRLGIIYTPDEIVRFMIQAADYLTSKHFGKTLGDKDVEILDPATGTGTFITELIEYLPEGQLKHKYQHEIHCNEVAILPYYIANLNIEYTYKQKMGEYLPFENICFLDTLDNMGFQKMGKGQTDFFAMVDANIERIQRQNERRISVIIGNPPYNANQLNENENNKNREYPTIDRRIKDTYIHHSTAQKTKLYDMYTRFLRWASDRLDRNGIVAFVSNNSFLDARTYDGFRKVVAEEFNEIYVIDLKGNARTSGERRRREGGNVFSDQIRVGVAIYFLVRKEGEKGCRIWHNAVDDFVPAEEKKAYLRDNQFDDLQFQPIRPDKSNNWLNLSESDWDGLIPIASKEAKTGKGEPQAIFQLYSLGVVTNRDEWVYDESEGKLREKIEYFIGYYNQQVDKHVRETNRDEIDDVLDNSIKWTRAVKNDLAKGKKYTFNAANIVNALYRPFIKRKLYFARELNEMQYQLPRVFHNSNLVIALSGTSASKPFSVLASDVIFCLDLLEKTQGLSFYRYNLAGERVDNITDWALAQFRQHYATLGSGITKGDIFHYVYAVLHHPAYGGKYATNLKREFPRVPFYDDFEKWAEWGRQLMDLHLNYEQVEPYKLTRADKDPQSTRKAVVPRLIARKETGEIEIDTLTTLGGVPPEAWDYRLGTYTALEWVLERYKERKPKDPTIREKFNTYRFSDYKEHVVDLLRRVTTVSVETMRIIRQMPE
jgi:predicted helicase